MNNFSIDIHCHSSTRPFLSGYPKQVHKIMEDYDFDIKSSLLDELRKLIEEISHIRLHTQSNIDNLYRGNVRVAMVSVTPMEKGFCILNQLKKPKGLLAKLLKSAKNDGTISEKVINALTGFSTEDVKWVLYKMNDYYTEYLLEELKFLNSFDGQIRNVGTNTYTIRFPKNNEELVSNLKDTSIMNLIITIEGAHSLGPVPSIQSLLNNQDEKHAAASEKDDLLIQTFEKNISHLKQKTFCPWIISLNHHFWNGLGGHAKSITKLISGVISQDEGLNGPLNENGKAVLRALLSTSNGRRIHIDIKHMSPKCRQDYYAFLDTEFATDSIPIISSHTGILSKYHTLQELRSMKDDDELTNKRNYLHEQTINMCKEDILRIHASKGVLGIQLDEKRIMGHKTLSRLKQRNQNNTPIYCEILWVNIFQIIRFVNQKSAWDIITIGSDYDGMINHLDLYPTEADMASLRFDLMQHLAMAKGFDTSSFNLKPFSAKEIKDLMFGYTIDEIIDKLFSQNALDFIARNFSKGSPATPKIT